MSQHNKKEWLDKLSWVPAVIIMLIIYSFSAKPAEVSQDSSYFISYNIIDIYQDVTQQELKGSALQEALNTIDFYVRKTAHGIEYAALAFWIGVHFIIRGYKRSLMRIWSLLLSMVYAISDEVHQLFVPGRSGQIRDVMIDTLGAFIGIVILSLFLILIDQYKKGKKESY